MNASIFCKKIFSSILFRSGIVFQKFAQFHDAGIFIILMYHRITPPGPALQDGMYVTPQTFSNHLRFLEKFFTVVSLGDLTSRMANGAVRPREKTICVLTFDDGWLDFFTFAYPRLLAHGLPATVFLPTGFIGSENEFWTERFSFLLTHRQQNGLFDVSKSFDSDSGVTEIVDKILKLEGQLKDQLERGIELLKTVPLHRIERVLEMLAEIWRVPGQKGERNFINWDEVQEMLGSGLISFGSHTVSHQILTTLSDNDIQKELSGSLHELLDHKAVVDGNIPFCYPNGSCSPAIAKLVESSHYNLAVTTKKGVNTLSTDRFMLNRIGIHQDMTSTVPLFAARIAGFI